MTISDEDFREAYKPLHIPAHYNPDDSEEHKVIYALAQIGEGSAEDVGIEISKADSSIEPEGFSVMAASILRQLYDKGLIKGEKKGDVMHYNLSKITRANDGGINPDLLAPGLD